MLSTSPRFATIATALVFSNVLWGSTFLFGKIALQELPSVSVVFLRYVVASAALSPWLFRRGGTLGWHDISHFFVAGVLLVPMTTLLQTEGLRHTSATTAALILGTLPVAVAIAAVLVDGELMGPAGWVAVGVSTLGAAVLVGTPEAGSDALGPLLVLASVVTSTVWVLYTRRLVDRHGALRTTAWSVVLGTLAMAPPQLIFFGPRIPAEPRTWLAIVVLGVACTALAFGLWNWALQWIPSSRAAAFVNLEPLSGALLSMLVLREPIGLATLLGGGLILSAALLASRPHPAHTAPSPGSDRVDPGLGG